MAARRRRAPPSPWRRRAGRRWRGGKRRGLAGRWPARRAAPPELCSRRGRGRAVCTPAPARREGAGAAVACRRARQRLTSWSRGAAVRMRAGAGRRRRGAELPQGGGWEARSGQEQPWPIRSRLEAFGSRRGRWWRLTGAPLPLLEDAAAGEEKAMSGSCLLVSWRRWKFAAAAEADIVVLLLLTQRRRGEAAAAEEGISTEKSEKNQGPAPGRGARTPPGGEQRQIGVVRYTGVSNETSYGVVEFVQAAKLQGLPKIVSIQNCYSLLLRCQFEVDLVEVCHPNNCNVGLLAYSPLAAGALTGKYLVANSEASKNSRLDLYPGYMQRYNTPLAKEATKEYVKLAKNHGLTPVQLALGFVRDCPFTTSTIIGATTMDQLKENISAFTSAPRPLPPQVVDDIQALFRSYKDPAAH